MKGDFDSLIYILITVVVFAISFMGKKKKKSGQINVSQSTEGETIREERPFLSNLEELLRQEMGIQNQPPVVNNYNDYNEDFEDEKEPEIVLKKEEILDSVPAEMLDYDGNAPYSIEYDDNLIQNKSIQSTEISNDEEINNPIVEDFDIQKAVIYSEILNPKYF